MLEHAGLAYLRTFPDFELGNVSAAQTFGLERVLALLEEVGAPHLRVPVIHIAGTKGKGSTAASVASILRAAGYRTGMFTQPHLVRLNERFQIDGVEITDDQLSAIMLSQIQPAMARLVARGITGVQQFEAQVTLAFLWFEAQATDVVVLEVGLGGRLDGTNVVPKPVVSTISPIGFDHMAILGDTLPLIAGEKAAIIKEGVPVVASPQPVEAETVLIKMSRRMHAALYLGGRDWEATAVRTTLQGTTFDLRFSPSALPDDAQRNGVISINNLHEDGQLSLMALRTPLLGAHQAVNAACAAVTAIVASRSLTRIDADAIRQGLAMAEWPGRLQVIDNEPTVIVDGAHTAESAEVLVSAIKELFPGKRVVVVCGIQGDKDIPNVVTPLAKLAASVVATRAHHQRAASTAVIAAAFSDAGSVVVQECEEPLAAVDRARRLAGRDAIVLVTGSLYLVGDVLVGSRSDFLEPTGVL
ncbi:MAG: FolC bifunctional protein [Chloroflexi bacterium]|nr:FolC bifunctional protein [Chloroflexota bacterium]